MSDNKYIEKSGGQTSHSRTREALKIPQELDNKAVLNVSSQRGFFDSKYQSHVDEFQRFFENQTEQEGEDRVSSYLDLSQTSPRQVVDLLKTLLMRTDPSRSGKWLSSDNGARNEPPPSYIANVTYLPELDRNGIETDEINTFTIDPSNYRSILPELRDFLVKKHVLSE